MDLVAGHVSGTSKAASLLNLFGDMVTAMATLSKDKNSKKSVGDLFGTSLTATSNLKRGVISGTSKQATMTNLFTTALTAVANLSKGKVSGTSTIASLPGVFGTSFTANANLSKGKVSGTSTTASLIGLFGNSINVAVNLVKGTASDAVKKFVEAWGFASGGAIDAAGHVMAFAGGGAITNMSREMWGSIPKYAGGGMHGSMFVAGENGPELVGHVNGRSEILNKSQLAQTMHSAIIGGMAQFVPYMSAITHTVAAGANAIVSANLASSEMLAGRIATDPRLTEDQMMDLIDVAVSRSSGGYYGESSEDIAEGVREGM